MPLCLCVDCDQNIITAQARGGLEALASATTQRGFAPRDGSGGLSGGTPAVEAGAAGGVGGVRIAAGPPPPEAGGGGGGWRERERAASIDKRKVCLCCVLRVFWVVLVSCRVSLSWGGRSRVTMFPSFGGCVSLASLFRVLASPLRASIVPYVCYCMI